MPASISPVPKDPETAGPRPSGVRPRSVAASGAVLALIGPLLPAVAGPVPDRTGVL